MWLVALRGRLALMLLFYVCILLLLGLDISHTGVHGARTRKSRSGVAGKVGVESLVRSGNEANMRGDLQEAGRLAQRALKQDPKNAGALLLSARVLINSNNIANGDKVLNKLLTTHPTVAEGWYKKAAVLFGDFVSPREACVAFATAARLSAPPSSHMYLAAAHCLGRLEAEGRECFALYHRAVRIDPTSTEAWSDMSFALSERGIVSRAIKATQRVLALKPTSAETYFALGNHFMSKKRRLDAARVYETSLSLKPDEAKVYHNLGFALAVERKGERAARAAAEAVQLYLDDPQKAEQGPGANGPMFVVGLANALRRARQFGLSRKVLLTLRHPSPPTSVESKMVINDHIAVRRDEMSTVMKKVKSYISSGKSRVKGAGPIATVDRPPLVPRAALLYLVGIKPEHWADLIDSLTVLERFFLRRFPYPVIMFHEGLSWEQTEQLRQIYDNLIFYKLDFKLPSHVNASRVPRIVGGHASIGYRHMCRFFSGQLYTLPIMQDYDWYWRVDTDSFLLEPLSLDPFRVMVDEKRVYGYMAIGREDEPLTTGLWAAALEYMREGNVESTFLHKMFVDAAGVWDRSYYYTNFEVGDLRWFRSEQYQSWFRHLDSLGGFYEYRWGDAPIRLLGLAMHAQLSQLRLFHELPYGHKVYVVAGSRGRQ